MPSPPDARTPPTRGALRTAAAKADDHQDRTAEVNDDPAGIPAPYRPYSPYSDVDDEIAHLFEVERDADKRRRQEDEERARRFPAVALPIVPAREVYVDSIDYYGGPGAVPTPVELIGVVIDIGGRARPVILDDGEVLVLSADQGTVAYLHQIA